MGVLQGKKIVLGITGSIAAYKACLIIRGLIKRGAEVQVVITPAGKEFITPLTLSALTSKPVISEFFSQRDGTWHSHVDLGLWADAMLVAPATASTIGKMAHGIADNMLLTTYLSMKAPVFVAPAMDLDMFAHPATQSNLACLRDRGNTIIEPRSGELASHLVGKGRMEEPEAIIETLEAAFVHASPTAPRVLITAGPTYERLDPVRFIGNYSSGKMGVALAEECASRGWNVELVCGPIQLATSHPLIHRTDVESAREMYEAALALYPKCEAGILCAAVADFTPECVAAQKIKREGDDLVLRLKPTQDIAAALGAMKHEGQTLVGFALETNDELAHAREKMARKRFDFIVLNSLRDKGAGFRTDTNKVTIVSPTDEKTYPLKPKKEVAKDIIDALCKAQPSKPEAHKTSKTAKSTLLGLLFLLLCLPLGGLRAQELQAKVTINRSQVASTESNVYDELQTKMQALLTERQWTAYKYKEAERIQCSFALTVNEYSLGENSFKCALLLSVARPVYNATYTTTLYSIKDPDFNFNFQATDQLEYSGPNNLPNNLVALLAYYAHIIIGYDLDSFSPMGGTTVLQTAEDIVTNAQDLGATGWKAFDENTNRFALLNDYLDGSMEPYRRLVYKYHREGLDQMADKPQEGRKAIEEAIDLLDECRTAKNMSHLPQLFSEYKRDELVNIFAGQGTSTEKQPIVDILKRVDISQSATWEKMLR